MEGNFQGNFQLTSPQVLNRIRQMLELIDGAGFPYWIDGGTLLGAVRHQDVIPWDDDGDVIVMKQDEQKMIEALKSLPGYGLSHTWCGYKFYPLDGEPIHYHKQNWQWTQDDAEVMESETYAHLFPFIDIFIVEEECDKIVYANKWTRKVYGDKSYYWASEVWPLRKYEFGEGKLFGPANPVPYLNRTYGEDWPHVAYKDYDHQNRMILSKEKLPLSEIHPHNLLPCKEPDNR